jgi:alkylation response protein AidB-like acyl-CoA dehydrogenase
MTPAPGLALSAAEEALAEHLSAVARDRLLPIEQAHTLDDGSELRPLFDALSAEGVLGLNVPMRFGGELDEPLPTARRLCLIRQALARHSSVGDEVYVAHNLGLYPVLRWGTSDACASAAEQGCDGRSIFAYALTEPAAGADPSALEATARSDGDGWVLSGTKRFISNAPGADAYVVFAKTDPERGGRGISAFLVLRDDGGFEPGRHLAMTAPHPIGEIMLRDCRLTADRLIGQRGEGMHIALETLRIFRVSVAAQAVGWIERACDLARERAPTRVTFGRPLAEHRGIRRKLADMGGDALAAHALVRLASGLADAGASVDTGLSSSAAKAFATEAAFRAAYETQQIWGAEGLVVGHPAQALLRETRQAITYEGQSEIQRKIIARRLGMDV